MNRPEAALTQSLSRVLSELPPLRAPADLQQRVWTGIGRRAALPWWRRSVFDWPAPARLGFTILGVPLVAAAIALRSAVPGTAAVLAIPGLRPLAAVGGALAHSGAALLRDVPAFWLHGGLLIGGAAYAVLAALLTLAWQLLIEGPTPRHGIRPDDPRARP